jgi:hypothetical protein
MLAQQQADQEKQNFVISSKGWQLERVASPYIQCGSFSCLLISGAFQQPRTNN